MQFLSNFFQTNPAEAKKKQLEKMHDMAGKGDMTGLIRMLDSKIEPEVYLVLISKLGDMKNPKGVEPLVEILSNPKKPLAVREAAVKALGVLYPAMDNQVRNHIDTAVQNISGSDDGTILTVYFYILRRNFSGAAQYGQAAIQPLLGLFGNDPAFYVGMLNEKDVFPAAANALKLFGPDIIQPILDFMPQTLHHHGKYLLAVLANFPGDARVQDALIQGLLRYDHRETAVELLTNFPGEQVTAALRQCLQSTLKSGETSIETVKLIDELSRRHDALSKPLFEIAASHTGGMRAWVQPIQNAAKEALLQ